MRMPGLRLPSSAHTRNPQGSARNDYPEAQLAGLHYTVAARRRHCFGARSEKLDDEQLDGVREFRGGVCRGRCQS